MLEDAPAMRQEPKPPPAALGRVPEPPFSSEQAATARRLSWACAALVTVTLCLIVLGALVRAHGAGLACPDWPLCFGRVVPEMDLKVAFEWSHRVLAGSVSLAFATLAVVLLRDVSLRRIALPYVLVGGILLAAQVLLGALTVWRLLASWTVTSHLVVGNSFCACLFLLALRLRDRAAGDPPRAALGPGIRGWVGAAALLLFFQIVIGGLVSSSFAGMACPEFPTCNGGVWFPSWTGAVGLHVHHRVNGAMLLAALGIVAWRIRRTAGVAPLAWGALALATAQAGIGVANVLTGIPVEVTGLHSLGAALLILAMVALVRATFAAPRSPAAPRA
jgi:cytochrome c oxidase assembly protein subunit 15